MKLKFMKYVGPRDEKAYLFPGHYYLGWIFENRTTVVASDGRYSFPFTFNIE